MTKKKHLIQRVEILTDEYAIHCPFCGAEAIAAGDEGEMVEEFCKHILFMAHDEGFEYRSSRFDELMGVAGVESDEIEFGDKGVDGYTDKVNLVDSVKFALYQPAPSFFGAYVGFAPTADE
jgi:hypothetical protein